MYKGYSFIKENKIALGLGFLSILIRALMIFTLDLRYSQCSDFGTYLEFTKLFVENGFIPSQAHISSAYGIYLFYVPVYWLVGGSLKGILFINTCFTGILTSFFYLAGKKFAGRKFALFSTLLFIFLPSNIIAHGLVCSEIPSLFLGLFPILALYTLSKTSRFKLFIYGGCLGFSFLIRPINISFLFGILLLLLLNNNVKKDRFSYILIILGFIFIILPFSMANFYRYHKITPTQPKTGYILTYLYRNSQYALGKGRDLSLVNKRKEIYQSLKEDVKGNPYFYDSLLVKEWFRYFLKHPKYLIEDMFYNAYPFLRDDKGHHYTYTYAKKDQFYKFWDKILFSKIKIYYDFIYVTGISGLMIFFLSILFTKQFNPLLSSLSLIFFIQTLGYMITFGKGRFHFCIVPILIWLSSFMFYEIFGLQKYFKK